LVTKHRRGGRERWHGDLQHASIYRRVADISVRAGDDVWVPELQHERKISCQMFPLNESNPSRTDRGSASRAVALLLVTTPRFAGPTVFFNPAKSLIESVQVEISRHDRTAIASEV
jgi:hypothetical protein